MTEANALPSTLKRLPLLLIRFGVDAIGLYTTILLIAWWLTGEGFWLIALFVNLMPAVFYPIPFTALMSLLLRKRLSIVLQLLPLLSLLWLYGGAFLPKTSPITDAQTVTILSYNLLFYNERYDAISATIRSANADIVTMQEVSDDLNTNLRERLLADYPYWYHAPYNPATEARLTISRYPIMEDHLQSGALKPILYLRSSVDVNGKRLEIYNTHVSRPSLGNDGFDDSWRNQETAFLLADLQAHSRPATLIIGDFNMSDTTEDYRLMAGQFDDVYRTVGYGFGTTFENYGQIPFFGWIPTLVRLDYAFITSDLIPLEARVLSAGSSDHLPVLIKLAFDS